MQHEITNRHPLLDEDGHLVEAGYTKRLLMDYKRTAIKAAKHRIKEWDYYLINTNDFAVALTIDDNSYMALDSISLLDFRIPWEHTNSPMKAFTFGKVGFPCESSSGNVASINKKYSITFDKIGPARVLKFHMDNFYQGNPIDGEITLIEPPEGESMVICTPFAEDPKAFYYNQKINCMPASGTVKFGDDAYEFEPGKSFGVLDWGRGVWTRENTWYWGSASGAVEGEPFGFNIGYGFGDTSAASENMLFYKQKAHKLSQVTFNIPMGPNGEEFTKPWTFTSDDGRFEMDFVPIMDRASCTDVKLICSDQHQVFGRFTGTAVLDDGSKIHIKDFLGFAEKVRNKW